MLRLTWGCDNNCRVAQLRCLSGELFCLRHPHGLA
ncbi:DUF3079 domain-containing protein [Marinobacter nauticus]|nr:DUF3079 domain-containing protein [Marinobacter nauticus]